MWKEKLENIKALAVKQKEKGSKKNIENMVVFLIILIITLIAINTIWHEDEAGQKNEDSNSMEKTLAVETQENQITTVPGDLEGRLENILTKIEGVGKVNVLITYSETNEVIAMYNENQTESSTEEADTGGGTRKIQETDYSKEIVYKEENGEKVPVTQKLILPKIEGAIITAEGAKNAEVRTYIIQAVEAATGLATHKIQVFAMQG